METLMLTRERLLKLEKDTARIVERLSRIRLIEPTDADTSTRIVRCG